MKKEIRTEILEKKSLWGKYIIGLFLISMFSISIYANGNIKQGFIYGKILMKDSTLYEGPIRWGKEEALWGDMFNSTKEENENIDYLSKSDIRKLRKSKSFGKRVGLFFSNIFSSRRSNRRVIDNHQFICRFGDIKKITMRGSNRVSLTLKNQEILDLKGGSNDINAKLYIIDNKDGLKDLKWKKIESIEFLPTPDDLKNNFGMPLFGTVKTESGNFKGFIQWDHEECLSSDILNGYTRDDSKMNIKFKEIAGIKKYRDGSKVTLYSGKEYKLYDTNDVDDDNRGIVINDLVLGKVLVEWDEFISVQFEKKPKASIPAYNDYVKNKELFAKIKTRGLGEFEGKIIFDLDEELDNEMLEGTHYDINYYIPFRSIKTLIPRGSYSRVVLKNGKKLELEDGRDVSRDNDGILIWNKTEKPTYIPWRKIKEINFK